MTNYITTWNEAFLNLWYRVVSFLPQLGAGLLVLIIGLVIASVLSKLAYKLICYIRIDVLFSRIPLVQRLNTQGIMINLPDIVAQVVKWFFIIITIMAVSDILGLQKINDFLESILLYLPNVIVAVIIFGIGFVVGQLIADIIRKSALASKLYPNIANILALGAEWSIIVFSLMAGLIQLGVAASLIQILFTGIMATFALGFGLAFGLGGKERAARFLEEFGKNKDAGTR